MGPSTGTQCMSIGTRLKRNSTKYVFGASTGTQAMSIGTHGSSTGTHGLGIGTQAPSLRNTILAFPIREFKYRYSRGEYRYSPRQYRYSPHQYRYSGLDFDGFCQLAHLGPKRAQMLFLSPNGPRWTM